MRPTSARLSIEQLETRDVMATFGIAWPNPGHIGISFAPDGTQVLAQQSALAATLNAQLGTADWETEVLRGFQSWAAVAGFDLALTPDDGAAFGTSDGNNGTARGDIRIGGYGQSPDVLAITTPYDPTVAQTWAGDVFLNTYQQFAMSGTAGYDLYTAMVHEAGHALGLPGSADPNSVMTDYTAPRTGLGASDVAAIRALYGARVPDALEGHNGNDTLAAAYAIPMGNGAVKSISAAAELTTLTDVDYYSFTTPKGGNPHKGMTITLNTKGISLLTGKITLLDAAGNVVATSTSTGPLGDEAQIALDYKPRDTTYFVRVEGATGDVFSVGKYGLTIDFKPDGGAVAGPSGPAVAPSAFTYDSFASANPLATTAGYKSATNYQAVGRITTADPVDLYKFTSAQPPTGTSNTATITVQSLGGPGMQPQVFVYDKNYNRVTTATVAAVDDTVVVRLDSAAPNATYYLEVRAAGNPGDQGFSYSAEIDFWDTFAAARALATTAGYATATNYQVADHLTTGSDATIYSFTAPATATGEPTVMTLMAQATSPQTFQPVVTVYDKNYVPVAAAVQINQDGTYQIRVANAVPKASYFVMVAAANPAAVTGLGFNLEVDFRGTFATAVPLTATAGYAQNSRYDVSSRLSVGDDTQYYTFKSPSVSNGDTNTLRAVVRTADGSAPNVVLSLYDANKNAVPAQVLDGGNGVYVIQATGLLSNASYYVMVKSGDGTTPPPYALELDFRGNVSTAQQLTTDAGYAQNSHYTVAGSLLGAADANVYQFKSIALGTGDLSVLRIALTAPGTNASDFALKLTDKNRAPVAFDVIAQTFDSYVIRAKNLASGGDYFLEVASPASFAAGDRVPVNVELDFQGTYAAAQTLGKANGSNGTRFQATSTLNDPTDQSVYKFKLPGSGTLSQTTVVGWTPAPNQPAPDLYLSTSTGAAVPVTVAVSGNTVTITANALTTGVDYYLRVRATVSSGTQTVQVVIDGKDDFSVAQPLTATAGFAPLSNYQTSGQLLALADANFFRVEATKVPGSNVFTVTAQTIGVGTTPTIQVYDANQKPLSAVVLQNGGGQYVIQVTDTKQQTDSSGKLYYYVSVGSGVGQYRLTADFRSTFATAVQLKETKGFAKGTNFAVSSQFGGPGDVQFFQFNAADITLGETKVLTLTTTSGSATATPPAIAVFDMKQKAVPVTVVESANGYYSVRFTDTQAPDASNQNFYYVRLTPGTGTNAGYSAYGLTIDLRDSVKYSQQLAADATAAGAKVSYAVAARLVGSTDAKVMQFKSAKLNTGEVNVMVLTVKALDGQPLPQVTVTDDHQTVIAPTDVLALTADTYQVRFVGMKSDGNFFLSLTNGTGRLQTSILFRDTAGSKGLMPGTAGYFANTHYESDGSLLGANDLAVYSFMSPKLATGEVGTASVFVWTADPNAAVPQVSLVDASGAAVPAQVVANGAGMIEIRATNLASNKQYAVKVSPAAGTAAGAATDFDLLIDFRDTFSTAAVLTNTAGYTKNSQYAASGSLLDATDNRLFSITAPKFDKNEPGVLAVTLWGLEAGQPAPVVQVYDKNHTLMSGTTLLNANGQYVLGLNGLAANQTYFVEVKAPSGGGGYSKAFRLEANFLDTFGTARVIDQPDKSGPHTVFTAAGTVGAATGVEIFQIKAPKRAETETSLMTVTVQTTDGSAVAPRVTIYDENGQSVSAELVLNNHGTYRVQVPVAGSRTYFVVVQPLDGNVANRVAYNVATQFDLRAAQFTSTMQGSLTAAQSQEVKQLTVTESSIMYFRLGVSFPTNPPSGVSVAVRMTIYDANGNVVATAVAPDGSGNASTIKVALPKGTYFVRFSAMTSNGSTLPAVNYTLSMSVLTDPIGPAVTDPTAAPAAPTTWGGTPTAVPTYTVTTPPSASYGWLVPTDPYANPWWSLPAPAPAVWTNPVAVYGPTWWAP